MPLSPTDFYAYSRATGTPVPEDAEERARIASDVYNFRQNQLKTPEQGPNYGAIAGLGALGLGLATGGVGLARMFRGRAPQAAAKVVDHEVVRRVVQEAVPQSKVVPTAPIHPKQPSEIKPFNLAYIESTGAKAPDLTSVQQSEAPQLAAQQHAAVESGEDQATGRFQHMLQLNEDLDTSQIDVMEAMAEHQYRVGMEQDEPGHVPTRQLPDGLPHIQQEDPVAGAQNFLTQRRAELQKEGLSPGRIEQQLLAGRGGTALKQGLELWASTGDPATAQMISNTPATPLHIKPVVQLDSTASEIPTGSFYEGFKAREPFLDKLEGADIYYTNEISAIADKLQTVPTHIQNPHYQELSNTLGIAQHAWKQGNWSARPVIYNAKAALEKTVELIPNPEHTDLTHTLNYAHSRRNDVRSQIAAKQQEATDFPQLVKLKNIQEGVRGHYEVDPNTQEIIIDAQTNLPKIEVRTGRPSVAEGIVTEAASGTAIRGRTGQFDPEGQSKSSVGIYGIEPTNIALGPESMEAGIRPSAVPGKSFKVTSYNPEEVRQSARLKTMGERTLSKPEVARQSLDVAKKIRELQSSGRPDAQQQLQDYIQGLKD
jgi:hypothetical protein